MASGHGPSSHLPPMEPSWGRQSPLPGWRVHVQCLLFRLSRQSLLSLLSFRGRPRFRLPCLLSPFLLSAKPSVHTDKGTCYAVQSLLGCSSPPPGREMSSSGAEAQGRAGWGRGRDQGLHPLFRPRYQGTIPLRARSPHSLQPRPTLIHATMLRAACCLFSKPCCFLASPMSPVSSPAGINTEYSFQCPGSLAAALTQLPPPTPSHQAHCCPGYPSSAPEPEPSPCSMERNRPTVHRKPAPSLLPSVGMFRCCP